MVGSRRLRPPRSRRDGRGRPLAAEERGRVLAAKPVVAAPASARLAALRRGARGCRLPVSLTPVTLGPLIGGRRVRRSSLDLGAGGPEVRSLRRPAGRRGRRARARDRRAAVGWRHAGAGRARRAGREADGSTRGGRVHRGAHARHPAPAGAHPDRAAASSRPARAPGGDARCRLPSPTPSAVEEPSTDVVVHAAWPVVPDPANAPAAPDAPSTPLGRRAGGPVGRAGRRRAADRGSWRPPRRPGRSLASSRPLAPPPRTCCPGSRAASDEPAERPGDGGAGLSADAPAGGERRSDRRVLAAIGGAVLLLILLGVGGVLLTGALDGDGRRPSQVNATTPAGDSASPGRARAVRRRVAFRGAFRAAFR